MAQQKKRPTADLSAITIEWVSFSIDHWGTNGAEATLPWLARHGSVYDNEPSVLLLKTTFCRVDDRAVWLLI